MNGRKHAIIVFYDTNKKILLQNRKNISKRGEEWGFFGGGLEKGETPEEAVVRETQEELGYDLKDYKYIGNYSNALEDGFIVDREVFISPLEDKLSKFELKEGLEMKLFPLEEARKLKMVPGDYKVIDMIDKSIG